MTRTQARRILAAITLICGIVAAPVLAAPADQAPIAHEQVGGTLLSVTPQIAYQNVTLRVSGPEGYSLKKQLPAGTPITADLLAEGDRQAVASDDGAVVAPVVAQFLVDGRYKYEVVFTDAAGEVRIHNALFFVENGALVSRETVRARLGDVGQDLGAAANTSGTAASLGEPSQEAGTELDIFTVVDDADDGTTRVGLDSDSPGNSLYWGVDNVGGDLEFHEDPDFTPPGTARVTFERGGQVGIGTTAPAFALHVAAGGDIELDSIIDWLIQSDSAGDFSVTRQGGAQAITVENDISGGSTDNVGIKQVNPLAPLHISGVNGSGVNTLVDGGSLQVQRGDTTPNIRFLKTEGTDQSWLFQNNTSTGTLAFRNETGAKTPLQIFTSANAQLLQLTGDHINVNGRVLVNNSQVHPDYVFEEDYKLMSLEELEAFVRQNKHLPGVQSADEVKKQGGLDLSGLSYDLLEKVEELTLYTIQQDKTIAELRAELQAIKQAMEVK